MRDKKMDTPRGLGPWHVGLFFNLTNPKRQTELRIHGQVHMYAIARNAIDLSDAWVPMMIVGPFMKWRDALGFFHIWSRQTRGKARRLRRGIALLRHYHRQYQLCMWIQPGSLAEAVASVEAARPRVAAAAEMKTRKQRIQRLVSVAPVNCVSYSMQHVCEIKKLRK